MLWMLLACADPTCTDGFSPRADGNCYPDPEAEPADAPEGWQAGEPPSTEELELAIRSIALTGLPSPHHVLDRQAWWFGQGDEQCPGDNWGTWRTELCTSDSGVDFVGKTLVLIGEGEATFAYGSQTAAMATGAEGGLATGGGFAFEYYDLDPGYELRALVLGDFIEDGERPYAWMQGSGQAIELRSDGEVLTLEGGVGHPQGALFFEGASVDAEGCLEGLALVKPIGADSPWTELELGCSCAASELGEVCMPELSEALLELWTDLLVLPEELPPEPSQ
jgi:hypothetical protein